MDKAIRGIIIFVLSFFYLLALLPMYNYFSDEGIYTYGAERILNGQVPFRDFFANMGPANFYLLAGLFKLFGIKISVVTGCTLAIFCLIAVFMYLTARELELSEYFSILAVLFFIIDKPQKFMLYSHHWTSTLFALISAYFFIIFIKKESPTAGFVSGFFAGMTTLFFYVKGIPLFAGSLLCIFLFLQQNNFLKNLTLFSSGFLTPIFLTVLYFFTKNATEDFIYKWLVWPLRNYSEPHSYPSFFYPAKLYLQSVFQQGKILSGLAIALPQLFIGYNIFISVGIFTAMLIKGRLEFFRRNSTALAFLILILGVFLSVLYRADDLRLTIIYPFTLICFLLALKTLTAGWEARERLAWKMIVFSFMLSIPVIAAFVSLMFNINSTFKYSQFYKKLSTPRGEIVVEKDKAEDLIRGYEIISDTGESRVFIYHCLPSFYFIWALENPTGYDCIVPHYNTEKEVQSAIDELKVSGTKTILGVPIYLSLNRQYFPMVFIKYKIDELMQTDPIIAYANSNFEPVMNYGEVNIAGQKFFLATLFRRKTPEAD